MPDPTVLYAHDGRIARITLNRPAKLTAVNGAIPRELEAGVGRAYQDDQVHVIVLSDASRAFCAGYDLEV